MSETNNDSTVIAADTTAEWCEAQQDLEIVAALEGSGIRREVAKLLANRGVSTALEARAFLEPSLDQLLPPLCLPGMRPAVERITRALEQDEGIAVVGDYDADGISGTAVLTACLRIAGGQVTPILPHRLRDGYGFQPSHVERAEAADCRLIITVDCGTSSMEAAERAAAREVDVIVTDHHLPGERLPPAVAIVNPLAHDGEVIYENPDLCGAGIALKVGIGVLERVGKKAPIPSLLRVASIGTVADLVPLRGENRTIATLGLRALGNTKSVGLRALMDVSAVKPPVLAEDIGYRLAPRLNAAGRLDAPDQALELLLTKDAERARELAQELDQWNQQRQSAERTVVDEARERFLELDARPRVLVAAHENWHRGVVGIAAGRIARSLHRPTILMERRGDVCIGSGRSIESVHLHDFLARWRSRFERFGGHSQAVGLTIRADSLDELVEEWNLAAQEWPASGLIKRYTYDFALDSVRALREQLYYELEELQPFGQANPAPLMRVGPLQLARPVRKFGKGHLDLMVEDLDGQRLRVTGWNWEDRIDLFDERFEILCRMTWDSYLSSPAGALVDARPL